MTRRSLTIRLRGLLASLAGPLTGPSRGTRDTPPGRGGTPTSGDVDGGGMPAISRCAFDATAAYVEQDPEPSGAALRRLAALADETAARLGLSASGAEALRAALLVARLGPEARQRLAIPAAVAAQGALADRLLAAGDPPPGAEPAGAAIDPLTRLPLLPFLFGSFEQEIRRAGRLRMPLSLIQIDIEGFRDLNARYGRSAGDRVLRGVARAIRSTLRPGDTCVRAAGDEFIVTVPGVGTAGIAAVIARLEEAVRRHKFAVARGKVIQVGVSAGAAAFPGDGRTHEALLATAEARRIDGLLGRRRSPDDAGSHLRFPGRPDVPVN